VALVEDEFTLLAAWQCQVVMSTVAQIIPGARRDAIGQLSDPEIACMTRAVRTIGRPFRRGFRCPCIVGVPSSLCAAASSSAVWQREIGASITAMTVFYG